MKEATGELNMTVVTIVAIAAVALLFYVFLWPTIQKSIVNQTCKTYGANYGAVKVGDAGSGTGAEVAKWKCCPAGVDKDGKTTGEPDGASPDCKDADLDS